MMAHSIKQSASSFYGLVDHRDLEYWPWLDGAVHSNMTASDRLAQMLMKNSCQTWASAYDNAPRPPTWHLDLADLRVAQGELGRTHDLRSHLGDRVRIAPTEAASNHPHLVLATPMILASSLAFIDGSVVNVDSR